ncbi:hypothetical protein F4553_005343 [Allocatelliglobosispora scoriae]|uniref:Uncharacterized protein n=1 Tax=Allocatelliglobosispora scoriae TaxID=643052 RepID=A0A841BUT7_9ACTN|nr:hypothetical protein [Allocatelliglobosispora scoriae]MBB5871964.1 hypothetical protein [Allocatelliglobosispora scoriae]
MADQGQGSWEDLARDVAETLVKAMATTAWSAVKQRIGSIVGQEGRMDRDNELLNSLGPQETNERRSALTDAWRIRLLDLLEDDPSFATALRSAVGDKPPALPATTIQTISAGPNSTATMYGGHHFERNRDVNINSPVNRRKSFTFAPFIDFVQAHKVASAMIALIVVVGGVVGGAIAIDQPDSDSVSPYSDRLSATAQPVQTAAAPTPTLTPVENQALPVVDRYFDVTNALGYSFQVKYSFSPQAVTVDLSNDPPGRQTIEMTFANVTFTAENTTPGRDYNPWDALAPNHPARDVSVGGYWPAKSAVCKYKWPFNPQPDGTTFHGVGPTCFFHAFRATWDQGRGVLIMGENADLRGSMGIFVHGVKDADVEAVRKALSNGPVMWAVINESTDTLGSQCAEPGTLMGATINILDAYGKISPQC